MPLVSHSEGNILDENCPKVKFRREGVIPTWHTSIPPFLPPSSSVRPSVRPSFHPSIHVYGQTENADIFLEQLSLMIGHRLSFVRNPKRVKPNATLTEASLTLSLSLPLLKHYRKNIQWKTLPNHNRTPGGREGGIAVGHEISCSSGGGGRTTTSLLFDRY